MSNSVNSYLWIPDIMRLSGFFNDDMKEIRKKNTRESEIKCENNKNICPKSKIKLVIGTGRYVCWNFEPKMIIDLDWIELNSKSPINVILTGEEKIKQVKKDKRKYR
ncbi:MAG: hypothetical protein JSU91_06580 [Thermoplasmatales archaeon]|nr:MAG: hypothetical protein JSU91_06580 [Thermoplasmatales archaeon]